MKNILLANIGNRNIKYLGKTYPEMSLDVKRATTFRELTQQWLSAYETERPHLELNILNDLVGPNKESIEQIILFSSNQIHEQKQDQDTLYEAQLMKRLVEEIYEIPVIIDEIQCRVTDNESLLKLYRNRLRVYKQRHPERKFIICDAGGTAQQKASLKIMAEYILGEDQYEVHYVNPNGTLELVPQQEYRRVIDSEQIRSLISNGQYAAALTLRGYQRLQDVLTSSGVIDKLLLFAFARFNRLDDLINKTVASLGKKVSNYPELLSVSQQVPVAINAELSALLDPKSWFSCGELLLKTSFLLNTSRFNEAILTFAVCYETYLSAIINKQYGYNLLDDDIFNEEKKRLENDARQKFANIDTYYSPEKALYLDIPLQIVICKNIEQIHHQTIIDSLDKWISKGKYFPTKWNGKSVIAINTVRNKIAHKGLYVTDDYLKLNLPYFTDLISTFYEQMNIEEQNPFANLNQKIMNEL